MPSLFRFLFFLAILAGLAYGAMFALVLFVEPTPREMRVRIPTSQIDPVRVVPPSVDDPAPIIEGTDQ